MVIHSWKNYIETIKNEQGVWLSNQKDFEHFFTSQYKELLSQHELDFPKNLNGLFQHYILDEENHDISAIPLAKDIHGVLFHMNPTKSPGLDGMPALIFRQYRHIIGQEVECFSIFFFFPVRFFS